MMRRWQSGRTGWQRRARAFLVGFLALLMGIPAPVMAQIPSGGTALTPTTEPTTEPTTGPQQVAPRTIREPWAFPNITIVEPRNGAIVTRQDMTVTINFQDPRGELDLHTLQVLINGTDRTQEFQVSANSATWNPQSPRTGGVTLGAGAQSQSVLVQGQNIIVATIKNANGNLATTSSAFIFDTSTLLAPQAAPRSPLERAFLQPPPPPPSGSVRRAAPGNPPVSRDLTQFGYESFRAMLPTLLPASNLPVNSDYRLGPGDSLILYVWNIPGTALFDSTTLMVDRTGSVFVPRVGSVPVNGLTLAQAQEVLRTKMARYFSGFEIRLALGELRTIAVYVIGEVARPGTYNVSPFSTVLDALFAAGGPAKMGTLRAIRVTRNGQVVGEVDLYDFLLRGIRTVGPTLQTGDTIFVPPIGAVAGIAGEVKRPGIYELRPGTTVGALLAMAGGPLPTAQLDRIQVERVQGSSGKTILDVPFATAVGAGSAELLQDGDLVTVFQAQDLLRNVVTLEGFVRTPGQYEWKPGMRLSDLLKPETVLPEAYKNRVEVVRIRPDFSREVLAVNLHELWGVGGKPDPTHDILLEPQDKISVKSEVLGPETVTLSGEVRRPGVYSITKGELLSSVIERAGGFLPDAFLKGAVFTREALRQREREQVDRFARTQAQAVLAESAAVAAGAVEAGTPEAAGAQAAVTAQRQELVRSITSAITVGRITIHLEQPEQLKGTPNDISLENGDVLLVPPQPSSVLVIGAVRNSTSIFYKPGENIEYYIGKVGGFTRQADAEQSYILQPDGTAIASFVKMRKVEAGDAIIVPLSTEAKISPFTLWKDMATIVGNIAIPFGVIAGLLR